MRLLIRVRPGARADAVGGSWDGRHGRALLVAVRARAIEGSANEAVVDVLAAAFDVPRRDVVIVSGHRSRDKVVEIGDADPTVVATLLGADP